MRPRQAHHTIERISNLLRNALRYSGSKQGLQPIHMEALSYLSSCNRYSNTPQGVTDYLGLTKGTVSQTLNLLVSKGLIKKIQDRKDGRKRHLTLTSEGHKVIKNRLPAPVFLEAYKYLAPAMQSQFTENLELLLRTMQQNNALKSFGVCHSCRFNQQTSAHTSFCQLTEETLSKEDTQHICREHEYGAPK